MHAAPYPMHFLRNRAWCYKWVSAYKALHKLRFAIKKMRSSIRFDMSTAVMFCS